MSSAIGKRSGNRGECAQPCRKFYTLEKNNKVIKNGFLLSTKELNTLEKADAFKNSNIDSIKIEGRMRSPEYVYATTKAYRNKLDGKDYSNEDIEATFSREFTEGLIFNDKNTLSQNKSNKRGVLIGETGKYKNKKLELILNNNVTLVNGDGLSFDLDGKGTYVNKLFNKAGNVLKEGKNRVFINFNEPLKPGTKIYRSFDKRRVDKLRKEALAKPEFPKKPINFDITIKEGQPVEVKIDDSINEYIYISNIVPQIAKTKGLTKEDIKNQFSKLGNTDYELASIRVNLDNNLFLPKSELNLLRKESLKIIESTYNSDSAKITSKIKIPEINIRKIKKEKELSLKLNDLPDYNEIKNLDIDEFILKVKDFKNLNSLVDLIKQLKQEGKRVLLTTETVLEKDNIEEIKNSNFFEVLENLSDGLLVTNYEILELIKNKSLYLEADRSFNVFNKEASQFLKRIGFSSMVLSDELSKDEINALTQESEIDTSLVIYGKRNLMISKNCVLSCKTCKNCRNEGWYQLKNQNGDSFDLKIENNKNYIFNSNPTFLPEAYLSQNNINKFIIDIQNEELKTIPSIIESLKYNKSLSDEKGRYYSGVN